MDNSELSIRIAYPQKIKHNSIMMDFDLFIAEKLQELREASGSQMGFSLGLGEKFSVGPKGTIDQHEKHWNFRCRFEHKHVVVNVSFSPGVSSSNLSYGTSQSETMDFPYLCFFNSG